MKAIRTIMITAYTMAILLVYMNARSDIHGNKISLSDNSAISTIMKNINELHDPEIYPTYINV